MKTKLILAGFLALAAVSNAQMSPVNTGQANQQIGCLGTNGGVEINNSLNNSGHATLYLKNMNTMGHNYSFSSCGNYQFPGDLSLFDWSSGNEVLHVLGTNANIGIGTQNPSEQLHTTGGVRFQGLITDPNPTKCVSIDPTSGKLYYTALPATGITNACINNNIIPRSTTTGNLTCSQIYDDGSHVGIDTNPTTFVNPTSFAFTYNAGSWFLNGSPMTSGYQGAFKFLVNGYTSSTGYYASSDERFKKDIHSISNALAIINKLDGKTYNWRTDEFKDRGFSTGPQIGFIAQELEKVIPEVVATKADGYKSVSYDMIIPILTQGIKEQQVQMDAQTKINEDLKAQISDLQKQLNSISGNKTGAATGIDQINSGADGFALDQNVPNPFSGETNIKYTLTEQTKTASLFVYDLSGKQLTSFPLDRTASSITITSDKLAAGIYIYSVIADGKIMDSKRMVVADK